MVPPRAGIPAKSIIVGAPMRHDPTAFAESRQN
jgi:hypothetical protein